MLSIMRDSLDKGQDRMRLAGCVVPHRPVQDGAQEVPVTTCISVLQATETTVQGLHANAVMDAIRRVCDLGEQTTRRDGDHGDARRYGTRVQNVEDLFPRSSEPWVRRRHECHRTVIFTTL